MLNEAWKLVQALERANIPFETPHPFIQSLPRSEKNVLRIRINDNGFVVAVEDITEEWQ